MDPVHDKEQKACQKADVLTCTHLFNLPDSCLNQRVRYWTSALCHQRRGRKGTRWIRNVWISWCSSVPQAQPTDLKCNIKENTAWPLTVTLFIVKMLQGSTPLMWSVLAWLDSLTAEDKIFEGEMILSGRKRVMIMNWTNKTVQSIISAKRGKFLQGEGGGSRFSGRVNKHMEQSNYPNLDWCLTQLNTARERTRCDEGQVQLNVICRLKSTVCHI